MASSGGAVNEDSNQIVFVQSNQTLVQQVENTRQQDFYDDHLRHAYDEAKANRPAATSSAYEPKKKEYMAWCDEMFDTPIDHRYIVSEGSLVAFLQDKVIGRRRKTGKEEKEIGESTVNQYVNALTELYKV